RGEGLEVGADQRIREGIAFVGVRRIGSAIFNRRSPVQTSADDLPMRLRDRRTQLTDILIALFAAVTAYAAIRTWLVYEQIRDHAKVIERAYVSLSHVSPGLRPDGQGAYLLSMEIQND